MNRKALRAAAFKAAQDIMEKVRGENREMTSDETKAFEEKVAEVKRLDAEIAEADRQDAMFKDFAGLKADEERDEKGGAKEAPATLGTFAIKHLGEFISQKRKGTMETPEYAPEAKAATDTRVTTGYEDFLTQIDRSVITGYRPRPVVASLLGSGTLSGNAIAYYVEGALEGDFTTVAEGGQKPQLHVANPTKKIDALKEIAGWIKITDDMAEDLPFVVSEINDRLLYRLSMVEEAQLLSGDGQGNNLTGLLNRSGLQTLTQADASHEDETAPDAIFRAMTSVQSATGLTADAIVINPVDYQAIRLSKDANDQYMGGGFFYGQYGQGGVVEQPPLWGMRTVVTAAIPAKTVVVGALRTAATVYRKGGVRVESTNSHVDDFTNDRITIRARERLALAVRVPSAIAKVTLA